MCCEAELSDIPVETLNDKNETRIYFLGEFPNMEQVEKFFVKRAIKLSNGNQSVASRMLGMSQATFHRRLKEFGIE